ELFAACDRAGRDAATITISVQLRGGDDRATRKAAVEQALAYAREGCAHMILTMPAALGPDGLTALAREVVRPLRECLV
ncbi:MAG: hypothetical protein ACR2JZ_02500, partial [Candidatus Limnocylindrales bacterium]